MRRKFAGDQLKKYFPRAGISKPNRIGSEEDSDGDNGDDPNYEPT